MRATITIGKKSKKAFLHQDNAGTDWDFRQALSEVKYGKVLLNISQQCSRFADDSCLGGNLLFTWVSPLINQCRLCVFWSNLASTSWNPRKRTITSPPSPTKSLSRSLSFSFQGGVSICAARASVQSLSEHIHPSRRQILLNYCHHISSWKKLAANPDSLLKEELQNASPHNATQWWGVFGEPQSKTGLFAISSWSNKSMHIKKYKESISRYSTKAVDIIYIHLSISTLQAKSRSITSTRGRRRGDRQGSWWPV